MAKPNSIRKKALDFARKRQWDKALAEFDKLVEIESHNPNLFNEIGDLHIKLDNKREAYKSFHKAVDEYTKVGLNNNAVAVCKKIIRLNPGDHVVYGKLARLRHQQGFHKEAESYSIDFFGKAAQGPDVASDDLRELAVDIALAAEKSPTVLEKAADYLINCDLRQDAGSVLEKLYHYHSSEGNTEEVEKAKARMESIGFVPAAPPSIDRSEKLETIESHRTDSSGFGDSELDSPTSGSVPPHIRHGQGDDVAGEFGMVDIASPGDEATKSTSETETPVEPSNESNEVEEAGFDPDTTSAVFDIPASDQPDSSSEAVDDAADVSEANADENVDGYDSEAGVKEYVIPEDDGHEIPEAGEPGEFVDIAEVSETAVDSETAVAGSSETIDPNDLFADNDTGESILSGLASEVTADVDEDDYRSHYDLGMAYVEMELLNEAVREFQFAANSAPYRVRCLEMIGRCFIKQDNPQLAIKQLSRGLALVGADDSDALGIKYNLGLAYEMIGDDEKAQSFFEDVYVIDVSFRDIEEKVKKYAS